MGIRGLDYIYRKLRDTLKLPFLNHVDYLRRLYGVNAVRTAYAENLLLVLAYAAVLIGNIRRINNLARIAITSDHGEFLGEKLRFEHPGGIQEPEIREVPYFIVEDFNTPLATRYLIRRKIMRIKCEKLLS